MLVSEQMTTYSLIAMAGQSARLAESIVSNVLLPKSVLLNSFLFKASFSVTYGLAKCSYLDISVKLPNIRFVN